MIVDLDFAYVPNFLCMKEKSLIKTKLENFDWKLKSCSKMDCFVHKITFRHRNIMSVEFSKKKVD